MAEQPIRFDDGAAYERLMGAWSQLVGRVFLDWLSPIAGQRWIDVGCGNGVFTEQLMQRCAPVEVQGIDPSEGQIAYARNRAGAAGAAFQQGDAMALPFDADRFDAAVMALVISFVPDPAKAVVEMTRVVQAGGLVAAYMWDQFGGGSPSELFVEELAAMGMTATLPASAHISRMESLRDLWTGAGLEQVETKVIAVERQFENFEYFWGAGTASGVLRATLDHLETAAITQLKERLRVRLSPDGQGPVTRRSFANAIKGYVPTSP